MDIELFKVTINRFNFSFQVSFLQPFSCHLQSPFVSAILVFVFLFVNSFLFSFIYFSSIFLCLVLFYIMCCFQQFFTIYFLCLYLIFKSHFNNMDTVLDADESFTSFLLSLLFTVSVLFLGHRAIYMVINCQKNSPVYFTINIAHVFISFQVSDV